MVIENYKPVQIANLKTIHLGIQQQLFQVFVVANSWHPSTKHLAHICTTTVTQPNLGRNFSSPMLVNLCGQTQVPEVHQIYLNISGK